MDNKNVSSLRKAKGGLVAAIVAAAAVILIGVGAALASGGGNVLDGLREGAGGIASLLGGGKGGDSKAPSGPLSVEITDVGQIEAHDTLGSPDTISAPLYKVAIDMDGLAAMSSSDYPQEIVFYGGELMPLGDIGGMLGPVSEWQIGADGKWVADPSHAFIDYGNNYENEPMWNWMLTDTADPGELTYQGIYPDMSEASLMLSPQDWTDGWEVGYSISIPETALPSTVGLRNDADLDGHTYLYFFATINPSSVEYIAPGDLLYPTFEWSNGSGPVGYAYPEVMFGGDDTVEIKTNIDSTNNPYPEQGNSMSGNGSFFWAALFNEYDQLYGLATVNGDAYDPDDGYITFSTTPTLEPSRIEIDAGTLLSQGGTYGDGDNYVANLDPEAETYDSLLKIPVKKIWLDGASYNNNSRPYQLLIWISSEDTEGYGTSLQNADSYTPDYSTGSGVIIESYADWLTGNMTANIYSPNGDRLKFSVSEDSQYVEIPVHLNANYGRTTSGLSIQEYAIGANGATWYQPDDIYDGGIGYTEDIMNVNPSLGYDPGNVVNRYHGERATGGANGYPDADENLTGLTYRTIFRGDFVDNSGNPDGITIINYREDALYYGGIEGGALRYDGSETGTVSATKLLRNTDHTLRSLSGGEFEFGLYADDGNRLVATARNDAQGDVEFTIPLTEMETLARSWVEMPDPDPQPGDPENIVSWTYPDRVQFGQSITEASYGAGTWDVSSGPYVETRYYTVREIVPNNPDPCITYNTAEHTVRVDFSFDYTEEYGWDFGGSYGDDPHIKIEGMGEVDPTTHIPFHHDPVIENTYIRHITVSKVWNDNNDEFGNRPNSVVVEVYANGDTSNPVDTAALTAPDWSVSFMLDAHNANGEITYTVDEPNVPTGYTKTVSGDQTNGFTITNATATTAPFSVKVWEDDNDVAGERPESITMYVLWETQSHPWETQGYGYPMERWFMSVPASAASRYLDASNTAATIRINGESANLPEGFTPSRPAMYTDDWEFEGPQLPTHIDGEEVIYYLVEERVPHYKTGGVIVGNENIGITNFYQAPPQESQLTVNRIDEQGANAASTTLEVVEEMPLGVSVEAFVPSEYNLTIDQSAITPTVDLVNNTLSYEVPVANTKTFTVNAVRGSNITISNQTTSVPLLKTEGDGTQDERGDDITLDMNSASKELTVAAEGSGSGQGGDQPGDDPSNPNSGDDPISGGSSTNNPTNRTQGWLRVNSVLNTEATYDGFKVFDAAVVQDGNDYKGSRFLWESNAVQSAVMTYISSIDSNNDGNTDYEEWLATKYGKNVSQVSNDDKNNPQNAAEWIAIKIADSEEDTTANTTPKTTKGDTFATELAAALRNAGIQPTAVIDENQITPLDQGYWLVATTQSTIDDGEAGTAPIWAPVPSGGYTVDEKVSVPTFNKQVKDNTTDTTNWNKVADGSTGQWLDFKLTATFPANLEAYPTYPVSVSDVIPAGMDATIATDNGFSVSLAGVDITEHAEAGLANNVLTVSVADVLDGETLGVDVLGNETMVITYRAKLNGNSVKGSAGNDNVATLTYPADPLVPTTTGELESSARVLTYQIQVDKADEATRLPLDDAVFKVKTNIGGTDYWVKSDGSLVATEGQGDEFTTVNGAFTISGIDEGTYTIYETQAPTLYEALTSPLTVVLTATKNYAGGSLSALAATASGANGTLVSNPSASQDGVVGTVLATGTAEVRISDVKQIVLPLTGMPVKVAAIATGVVIAIASVGGYLMSKRSGGEEDEEE